MHDVVVIGAGAVGLAIARELSADRKVLLLDRNDVGQGTSWAAAGMLSPQSEANADGAFFQLSMASLRLYRRFVSDLKDETGIDPEYAADGLLLLASSEDEWKVLQRRCEWQRSADLSAELIDQDELRRLEPMITMPVAGALYVPGDHQVVPRKLVQALSESCVRRGVEIRTGCKVDEILSERWLATGVRAGSEVIRVGSIVAAAGVWTGNIAGMTPGIPLRPRKGQILSLKPPARVFTRMIRWGHTYFVPRRNGELVIGATSEDAGFDRSMTPAGLGMLLSEAQQISSHCGEFPIHETWSGLRPATPDELPVLGASAIRNLWYAAGHYRNGILLTPITATIVASLVRGGKPPLPLDSYSPNRFRIV